jgi:hypothetical protein
MTNVKGRPKFSFLLGANVMAKKAAVAEPKKGSAKAEVTENGHSSNRSSLKQVLRIVEKLGGDDVTLIRVLVEADKQGIEPMSTIRHIHNARTKDEALLSSSKTEGKEYLSLTKAGSKHIAE